MWRERKRGEVRLLEPVRVEGKWTPEAACTALEGVVAAAPGSAWVVDAARLHPIGSESLAALIAAALMAVSPGFIFYSRYAIHEVWLVIGTQLMAWGTLALLGPKADRNTVSTTGWLLLFPLILLAHALHYQPPADPAAQHADSVQVWAVGGATSGAASRAHTVAKTADCLSVSGHLNDSTRVPGGYVQ